MHFSQDIVLNKIHIAVVVKEFGIDPKIDILRTAHQIDREVSFEITMTFIIENVTLDNTKNTEKS